MSDRLSKPLALASFLFLIAPAISFAGVQTARKPNLFSHLTFGWTLGVANQLESVRRKTFLSAQDADADLPSPPVGRLAAQATTARPQTTSRVVSVSRAVFIRSVSTSIFLSTLIL
ncbi:MAG: hypothetical protein ACM3TN_10955 [Alphaproteobacteria bacterium]